MSNKHENKKITIGLDFSFFEDNGFMLITRQFDDDDNLVKTVYTIFKPLKNNENKGKLQVRYDYYSKDIGEELKHSPSSIIFVDTSKVYDSDFVPEENEKDFFEAVKKIVEKVNEGLALQVNSLADNVDTIKDCTVELFDNKEFRKKFMGSI